jgi:hypothetical protein
MFLIEINDPWLPVTTERIVASFDGRWWVAKSNCGRISPKHVTVISILSQRDEPTSEDGS